MSESEGKINLGVEVPGEILPSEVEQTAIDMGWNPEGVEGKRNLSAEEFIDRQPLYDDIRSLKKQARKLQDGQDALKESHAVIRAKASEDAIRKMQEDKKYALENEQYDAVIEIDDAIANERASANEEPAENVAFDKWVDSNEWYNQNDEMRDYADTIGAGYLSKNPKKDLADVYEYVRKQTERHYPEEFGGEQTPDTDGNRRRNNPVEGAGKGRSGGGSRYSVRDLPEDDRRIMETILNSTTMTKEQYLKDYFG